MQPVEFDLAQTTAELSTRALQTVQALLERRERSIKTKNIAQEISGVVLERERLVLESLPSIAQLLKERMDALLQPLLVVRAVTQICRITGSEDQRQN